MAMKQPVFIVPSGAGGCSMTMKQPVFIILSGLLAGEGLRWLASNMSNESGLHA